MKTFTNKNIMIFYEKTVRSRVSNNAVSLKRTKSSTTKKPLFHF